MDMLTAISENATHHNTWALSIFGGTLLTIVGTSHVSPVNSCARLFYLLFVPAWYFLGQSVYYGDKVQRHIISALMLSDDYTGDVHAQINRDFARQLDSIYSAGVFLALWLAIYTVWWISFRENGAAKE